jgi:hypothetical protein
MLCNLHKQKTFEYKIFVTQQNQALRDIILGGINHAKEKSIWIYHNVNSYGNYFIWVQNS